MAVSGTINKEPIKKQNAPMNVNVTETITASKLGDCGETKANIAEIMKATQPSKLVNVTNHEMLAGFHAKCA